MIIGFGGGLTVVKISRAGNFGDVNRQIQTYEFSQEKLAVHQLVEGYARSIKSIKQAQELSKYLGTKNRNVLQKKSPACARFTAIARSKEIRLRI